MRILKNYFIQILSRFYSDLIWKKSGYDLDKNLDKIWTKSGQNLEKNLEKNLDKIRIKGHGKHCCQPDKLLFCSRATYFFRVFQRLQTETKIDEDEQATSIQI